MISRGHASLCVVLAVALCVSGCERATDTSKDELLERTHHWKEPKVAIWYYIGSKQSHDYFRYEDLGVSQVYRVTSGDIPLPQTFPYTSARAKWLVMPWGPAAIRSQSSNQALERTAARCAFTFQMIKTISLEATLALGGSRSAFSR
jgi:hypothetical protein